MEINQNTHSQTDAKQIKDVLSDGGVMLPISFLEGVQKKIPLYCFVNEEGKIVEEFTSQVTYSPNKGKYNINKDSSVKFIISGNKEKILNIITEIIIAQMKKELQFGNVLSYPGIDSKLEEMILGTLIGTEHNTLPLMNQLSSYSNEVLQRSIHSCGVGIALGIYSNYSTNEIKAIGLGGLLHEYGYIINPRDHTVAGTRNLEMSFFTNLGRNTNITLDIIQDHHTRTPHKSPQVNCGKIAIHWCSMAMCKPEKRIRQIRSRRHFYCKEAFKNFNTLYDLMKKRHSH